MFRPQLTLRRCNYRPNFRYAGGINPTIPLYRLNSTKNDIFKLDIDLTAKGWASEKTAEKGPKRNVNVQNSELDNLKDIDSLFEDLLEDPSEGSASIRENEYLELDSLLDDISLQTSSKSHRSQLDTRSQLFADRDNKSVIESENELFRKIFETYSKTQENEDNVDRLQEQVLTNLQESFTKPVESETDIKDTTKRESNELKSLEKLPKKDAETLAKQSVDSIAETLEYLDEVTSKKDLIVFAQLLFSRFDSAMLHSPDFFLHKLKGETVKEYLTRHEQYSANAKAMNAQNPQYPVINAFSMPLIFNHILEVTCNKFYDGALALSLFNMTKNDLNLYSIVCNQQTYNEIIKVHWIFYGKSSLCEIELILVEMQNNGFEGDLTTFSILKRILTTHHKMRIGGTTYNPGGTPIWSQEDERRAKNIEHKLRKLSKNLSRKRFTERGY